MPQVESSIASFGLSGEIQYGSDFFHECIHHLCLRFRVALIQLVLTFFTSSIPQSFFKIWNFGEGLEDATVADIDIRPIALVYIAAILKTNTKYPRLMLDDV